MADTGTQPMTTGDSLESLSPTSKDTNLPPNTETLQYEWFAPLPTSEDVRRMQQTDVSQDIRYNLWGLSAAAEDEECAAAPSRIPDWVLSRGETQIMFEAGHGTTPDLIYARGALACIALGSWVRSEPTTTAGTA